MGRLFIKYLESGRIYVCTQCRTHLAECNEIVSRVSNVKTNNLDIQWQTWSGLSDEHCVNGLQKYFRINCYLGPAEEKMLMTGMHKVCDLYCKNCDTLIGWKYVSIYAYCIRKKHTMKPRNIKKESLFWRGLLFLRRASQSTFSYLANNINVLVV